MKAPHIIYIIIDTKFENKFTSLRAAKVHRGGLDDALGSFSSSWNKKLVCLENYILRRFSEVPVFQDMQMVLSQ